MQTKESSEELHIEQPSSRQPFDDTLLVPCNDLDIDVSNDSSRGIGSGEAELVRREHMSTTLVNDLLDQTAVVVWINLKAILSSLCDIIMV